MIWRSHQALLPLVLSRGHLTMSQLALQMMTVSVVSVHLTLVNTAYTSCISINVCLNFSALRHSIPYTGLPIKTGLRFVRALHKQKLKKIANGYDCRISKRWSPYQGMHRKFVIGYSCLEKASTIKGRSPYHSIPISSQLLFKHHR